MDSYPAKPLPPIFRGLTLAECEKWTRAHNWAYVSIVEALRKIQAGRSTSDYSVWFGSPPFPPLHTEEWDTRVRTVGESLGKMAKRMSSVTVVYRRSNDDAKCKRQNFIEKVFEQREAYVEILQTADGGPREVCLCPKAFDEEYLNVFYVDRADWARAYIVVHETYHAAVDTADTAAAADSEYSSLGCRRLAGAEPERAIRNAQNYAYFAMGHDWNRPVAEPDWQPDYGIWKQATAGAGWGGADDGPAATATTHTQHVVMVAWREPVGSGGRLYHRVLRVDGGRNDWTNPSVFRIPRGDGSTTELTTAAAPALAAWGQEFYCAYIDRDTRKLLFAKADTAAAMSTGNWSELQWGGPLVVPDELSAHVLHPQGAPTNPGAALAVYRPETKQWQFNQSAGLYCVYVDSASRLVCSAKLDGMLSSWKSVPFDRPRSTVVTPTLAEFDGHLVCMYIDGDTGKVATLRGDPVISTPQFRDSKPVVWREADMPALPLHVESIALARWTTDGRETLVAMGNQAEGKDGSLRYCSLSRDRKWTEEVRLSTLTSPNVPALACCESKLFLFCRGIEGAIQSRVA